MKEEPEDKKQAGESRLGGTSLCFRARPQSPFSYDRIKQRDKLSPSQNDTCFELSKVFF